MVEKQNRGDCTRISILQAAHDLFVSQGYHGTSMRQIASQAGIALGSLYNHFESKEDVFKNVFQDYHPYNDVLPAMMEASGETAEQVVRNALERILDRLNAANEIAVDAFLNNKIAFTNIAGVIEKTLEQATVTPAKDLDTILHADAMARQLADENVNLLGFNV